MLAFLDMELCKACHKDKDEIAGYLLLLQLWAWSRLHSLAPIPRGPSLDNVHIWGDLVGPHDLMWRSHLSFVDSGSHSAAIYRLQLDLELLACIDLVKKGQIDGDISTITAYGRQLLQNKFASGYYQDFPVEDRRAKEDALRVKTKWAGHRGGRGGVNAQQRLLGECPGANVGDDGYDDVEDGGSVHLDDERDEHLHDKEDMHTGETSTRVDHDHVRHREVESIVVDPKERPFLPNWNLLPSNDSLFTQSPCQAPLHQPLDRQQLPLAHQ
ncbi:hypothetical protein POM88_013928 [Heracleum sosnowskyi]|uniref:Aminotransferase-like plant mobile domain-containing protein n=1 Tax=Heracleum sosnowskyi TaxID=360622 RepID=A0AAD8J2S6_9APIA|nr:hypothetical protein POM88_013928 [Heracleum sosnowskyi]